ncbi:SCO family protein [Halarcobacter ebronensis]|uniref:SCO family protein n=2 Tax=Halarcobacter ebronensis TaxID=1462615 RepID=A0A4Q1AKD9_9BACT|nr:SCO family protein [Halarcobacter ebronensis]
MMKTFLKLTLSFLVAALLIVIISPYVDKYKEHKKYDFTLDTINGKISKDDFKGKVLAIYFGYTSCPDVCPTSLSSLAFALKSFDKKEIADFRGLFISVDPNRDSLENLEEYAKYFHPNFIGATSTKENIDDITKRYGTFYKKVELEGSAMNYSVSHTSFIYIFDKKGDFVTKIDHFSAPKKIQETLEKVF